MSGWRTDSVGSLTVPYSLVGHDTHLKAEEYLKVKYGKLARWGIFLSLF